MKRIFTLLVSALMCAGLYAQTTPTVFYVSDTAFPEGTPHDSIEVYGSFGTHQLIWSFRSAWETDLDAWDAAGGDINLLPQLTADDTFGFRYIDGSKVLAKEVEGEWVPIELRAGDYFDESFIAGAKSIALYAYEKQWNPDKYKWIDAPASSNVDEIVFTEAVSADNLAEDHAFSANGFIATLSDAGNKFTIDANKCRFGTPENYKMYDFRLKSGGASSSTKNFITLTFPSDGKLSIAVRSASSADTTRTLVITQEGTELFNQIIRESMAVETTEDTTKVKVYPYVEVNVKAGQAELRYSAALNFYSFAFEKADPVSIKAVCEEQKAKTVKMMQNGKLIIKKNGKTFNALGVEVR